MTPATDRVVLHLMYGGDMGMKLNLGNIFRAVLVVLAATASLFTHAAHATLIHVDEAQSSITFNNNSFVLDSFFNWVQLPPITRALSGSFDVEVQRIHQYFFSSGSYVDYDLLYIQNVDVFQAGNGSQFSFPVLVSAIQNGNFDSSLSPPFDGYCMCISQYDGPHGYSGSWDGTTFSMTGTGGTFQNSYDYTIIANATVPEPSTVFMMLTGLVILGVNRRRTSHGWASLVAKR